LAVRHTAIVIFVLLLGCAVSARAQPSSFETMSGAELYQAACAACHGADGRGNPPSVVGFDTPLPDFTDCSFATPEPDADWFAIAHEGGPVRAFDRRMPAFGRALSEGALLRVIQHLRGFCDSRAWPRGELNLPRPLMTEKAFPENETVLSMSVARGSSPSFGNTLIYEQRFGARSQIELAIPVELQKDGGSWQRGLGDVAVAVKHALFHDHSRGTIFSVATEAALPTGKETVGLGKGVTVFEPFVAFGQILPADGFVQIQSGVEVPTDSAKASKEAFIRTAIGKSLMSNRFGRTWSPMFELVGAREIADGESTQWDIVPQMQVTLSKRQHVMISAGLQIPVTARAERSMQLLTYVLWDWFDGGFLDGWR
jgi:hypothetical protein